jgi:methionyl aminopeptidase
MVIAIEPMVSTGDGEVEILEDDWTAITVDGTPAAHFEHTIAIRDGEAPEILTLIGRDEAICGDRVDN